MRVQASNCPKRLWSKAAVVSVGEKAHFMRQVGAKKVSDKRTNGGVENVLQRMSKLGSRFCSRISSAGTCLLAERHLAYSWHELGPGSFAERGNSSCDAKRKPYKCWPRTGKVSMRMKGADHPAVVMKMLQWHWSEGDVAACTTDMANQQWEEPPRCASPQSRKALRKGLPGAV